MRTGFKKIARGSIIGALALVITTLGISASDTLQGVSSSLLGQLNQSQTTSGCPVGMVATPMLASLTCVDAYEAAPASVCPHQAVRSSLETETNIANQACQVVSEAERQPWVYATREQARLLCMRAGKRLPTAAEWYQIAIGTPADACVINGTQAQPAGSNDACVSALGVFDTVGNAWEWTSEDVIDGVFNGRTLPAEGYVAQVAEDGMAVYTDTRPGTEFGGDFFWARPDGAYGVLRGGFYGSGEDAGVFATQTKTAPTMSTQAIGFRCVI